MVVATDRITCNLFHPLDLLKSTAARTMKSTFGLLCLLGAVVNAAIAKTVVVEHLGQAPQGWTKLGSANPSQFIRLSIALESHGHGVFEKTLSEVSDPTHSRYGQHLSREEASALIRPRDGSGDVVRRWLASGNVSESQIQDRGLFIDAIVAIGTAEKLLSTRYSVFQHEAEKAVGTLAYSVPEEVRPHITAVQPTTFFELAKFMKRFPRSDPDESPQDDGNTTDAQAAASKTRDCENNNTPSCLRSLYNMNNDYTKPQKRSLLGIVGYNEVSNSQTAIQTMAKTSTASSPVQPTREVLGQICTLR